MKYIYQSTPRYIQIETNILCNANCEFCTQKKVSRRPQFMHEHVWKKIIDDTRDIGITYRPFLLNEPFTDKRMPEICKYIKKDPSAKIEFNTNAGLLTPELSDELLDTGIDYIRFSIDGFYKDKYAERRKGLDLESVEKNVEYFCVKAKSYKTGTEVRMIAFPGSDEEQKLFRDKWAMIADKVTVTSLYRYPWEGQEEVVYKPCLKIKDEMFFYVNGKATLCCWDTNERAVIGDVNEQNVIDIWNSDIVKEYRDFLDHGQRDKINLCSRCDAYKNL